MTVVELRSPDRSDYLRASCIEVSSAEHPSLKVRVEADVKGFHGCGDAWLDACVLAGFLATLRDLEAKRQGQAELRSMSPSAFHLILGSLDRLGHLLVQFEISRSIFVAGGLRSERVHLSGALELDPSDLPGVLAAFTSLTADLEA